MSSATMQVLVLLSSVLTCKRVASALKNKQFAPAVTSPIHPCLETVRIFWSHRRFVYKRSKKTNRPPHVTLTSGVCVTFLRGKIHQTMHHFLCRFCSSYSILSSFLIKEPSAFDKLLFSFCLFFILFFYLPLPFTIPPKCAGFPE